MKGISRDPRDRIWNRPIDGLSFVVFIVFAVIAYVIIFVW